MLDVDQPIRTKRSGLRLYVVGHEGFGGKRFVRLGTRRDSHFKSGVPYNLDGTPVDECPWGEVENFEDDPFESVVDTEVERFNAKVREELGDSELFGLF